MHVGGREGKEERWVDSGHRVDPVGGERVLFPAGREGEGGGVAQAVRIGVRRPPDLPERVPRVPRGARQQSVVQRQLHQLAVDADGDGDPQAAGGLLQEAGHGGSGRVCA